MTKMEWSPFREPAPPLSAFNGWIGVLWFAFQLCDSCCRNNRALENRTLILIDRHRSQCEPSFMMVNRILSGQNTLDPPETRTDQRYFKKL